MSWLRTAFQYFVWLCIAGLVPSPAEVRAGPDALHPPAANLAQNLFPVRTWTTENGLPQNRISCLCQTRDGYLWIGTWTGLARFDGWRFQVFDRYNTPALKDDSIDALAEGTDGVLWIGTPSGLTRHTGQTLEPVPLPGPMRGRPVFHLLAASSGETWIEGGTYVTRLLGLNFSKPVPLPPVPVASLASRGLGELELLTDRHWLTISTLSESTRTNWVAPKLTQRWETGYLGHESNAVWIAAEGQLRQWQSNHWQSVDLQTLDGSAGPYSPRFISEDRSGRLWMDGLGGGLRCREGDKWRPVALGAEASRSPVVCMEQDQEGNIWVGTEHGLVQLHSRPVRAYTARDGLREERVLSVCEGKDDATIWVGLDRGLACIRSNTVVDLESDPVPSFPVRCVAARKNGEVWAARPGLGLMVYGLHGFRRALEPEQLPESDISALYTDRTDRLWIGTARGVAVVHNEQVVAYYTNWCGRSDWHLRCILQDAQGAFWFGAKEGLTRFRDGKFDLFTTRDGLTSNNIWCLHEDDDLSLWIGTENGLNRFHQGRFFPFQQAQGLSENAVNCILEDDFGYLWLSGLRGIYRIKREQLDQWANGRGHNIECGAFGTIDGMESSETNGEHQPSGWKSDDGRLWFPTIRGLVVIDPSEIIEREVPPSVIIEDVVANGGRTAVPWNRRFSRAASTSSSAPINPSPNPIVGRPTVAGVVRPTLPEITFPPGAARVLEFRYTATHFSSPERVRFAYRLEPHDDGWQKDNENRRVAFYTDLPPGAYQFRVKACNNHGVWNQAGDGVTFVIAPHYYQTWAFYSLCSTAFVGVAGLFHSRRIRSINRLRQLKQQHALEVERARIARDLHDDLGSRFSQIAVLQELAGRHIGQPRQARPHLDKLRSATTEAFRSLDEIVWAANPKQDSLQGLVSYLRQYVPEILGPAGIHCRLELPSAPPERVLSAQARHQFFLTVKEALQNVVKHAQATEVRLRLISSVGGFDLWIEDNGRGFATAATPGAVHDAFAGAVDRSGNGLENMRERMEQIGGHFRVQSAANAGTTVHLQCPWES